MSPRRLSKDAWDNNQYFLHFEKSKQNQNKNNQTGVSLTPQSTQWKVLFSILIDLSSLKGSAFYQHTSHAQPLRLLLLLYHSLLSLLPAPSSNRTRAGCHGANSSTTRWSGVGSREDVEPQTDGPISNTEVHHRQTRNALNCESKYEYVIMTRGEEKRLKNTA